MGRLKDTTSKRLRLLVLIGIAALSACQENPSGGEDQPIFGSCSAVMMTTDLGGSAANDAFDETPITPTAFEGENWPVDLPVTIAKNVDGVDPTSVYLTTFSVADGGSPFSGELVGELVSPPGTVGVVVRNELVQTISAPDGSFSFPVTEALFDVPIALVALHPEGDGPASYPIIVTLAYDPFLGRVTCTVHVTNTSRFLSDAETAADIQETGLAVSREGDVAFAAFNASNEPIVGTVSVFGGANGVLSDGPGDLLQDLEYANAGNDLYGMAVTGGDLESVSSSGAVSATDLGGIPEGGRSLRLHPSGEYAAVNVTAEILSSGEATQTVALLGLDGDSVVALPLPAGESAPVRRLTFAWKDNARIVMFKAFADGTFAAETYDVSGFLGGGETELPEGSDRFASDTYIGHPAADYGYAGRMVYECLTRGGFTALCGYAEDEGDLGVLISEEFDIRRPRFTSDGRMVTFEIEAVYNGDDVHALGYYDPATGAFELPSRGRHPRLFMNDGAYHVAYLSRDQEGFVQVSLYNSRVLRAFRELAGAPPALAVGANSRHPIAVTGGTPPYRFELVEGGGELNEATGLYTAPEAEGASRILVTDSEGNTTEIVVTVTAGDGTTGEVADNGDDTVENDGETVVLPPYAMLSPPEEETADIIPLIGNDTHPAAFIEGPDDLGDTAIENSVDIAAVPPDEGAGFGEGAEDSGENCVSGEFYGSYGEMGLYDIFYLSLEYGDGFGAWESLDSPYIQESEWDITLELDGNNEPVLIQHQSWGAEIAHLVGYDYDAVSTCDVETADFTNDIINEPFTGDRVILIRTDSGAVYKFGHPVVIEDDGEGLGAGVAFLYALLSHSGDPDHDGYADETDNCPMISNASQADADGDGIGDACDESTTDFDGDGYIGEADNCPDATNPDQLDSDCDGAGNVCDSDGFTYPGCGGAEGDTTAGSCYTGDPMGNGLEYNTFVIDIDYPGGADVWAGVDPAETSTWIDDVPGWDFYFACHWESEPNAVLIQNQFNGVEIAHLVGNDFADVTTCDIDAAAFTTDLITEPFGSDRVILIRTDTGAVYKIGDPVEHDVEMIDGDCSLSEVSFTYAPLFIP